MFRSPSLILLKFNCNDGIIGVVAILKPNEIFEVRKMLTRGDSTEDIRIQFSSRCTLLQEKQI